MTRPDEVKSAATRTVSPPNGGTKRARGGSDEEEEEEETPTRRVVQRTEESSGAKELSNEEAMVKILVKDLRSNDEDALAKTLGDLSFKHLYDEDDDKQAKKQEHFFQLGGHLAVVITMQSYPDNKKIQEKGISALVNATFSHKQLQRAIAKIGGMETVISAMKRFPAESGVISEGFNALGNLCFEQNANSNFLVTKIGGMGFLIERMKHFSDDRPVVEHASSLLQNLSDFAPLRKALVEAGSLSVLSGAVESHKGDEDIQQGARQALQRLALDLL